jgi:hypothetical protein
VKRIRRLLRASKPSRKSSLRSCWVLAALAVSMLACSVEPETPRPVRPSRLMTDGGGELSHALLYMAARPEPWRPGAM